MFLYNSTTLTFLRRVKRLAWEILEQEMHLSPHRSRVQFRTYFFPLNFVVFERRKEWGFFDPKTYLIGLHKALCYQATTEVLKDVLRHELAHYYDFILLTSSKNEEKVDVLGHGARFHQICAQFGWGPQVWDAEMNLEKTVEGEVSTGGLAEKEKVLEKVKKLLNLSSSLNVHEAQSALMKANEILLRHHWDQMDPIKKEDLLNEEEETCLLRVMSFKRNSAKVQAISNILETFYVYPVFNYGTEGGYLEVTGRRSHVLVAEYVCKILERELDRLWELASSCDSELKGTAAKNSFFLGVAEGYRRKHETFFTESSPSPVATGKSLMVLRDQLHQDLEGRIQDVYRGLRSQSSQRTLHHAAKKRGQEMGLQLNLHQGLERTKREKPLWLS